MLLLVGVEPVDGIDVLGVRLIKVGERYHNGSALREQTGQTHESVVAHILH